MRLRISKEEIKSLIEDAKSLTAKKIQIRESKYEEWMPNFVIEFAKKTGAIKVQLAAALDISWSTFCKWRQVDSGYYHEEFDKAVELANTYVKSNFISIGLDELYNSSENFNAILYQMLGRYIGEFSEKRSIKIKNAKLLKENMNIDYTDFSRNIINSVSTGEISPDEALSASNVLSNLARVEESTEIKKSMQNLEEQLQIIKNKFDSK